MSKVLIEYSTLKGIANTIREKTGYDSTMLPSEMPSYISEINTENVTVDGYKATEPLDLYTYSNVLVKTSTTDNRPPSPSGIKQILNDNNFIYYSSNFDSTNYIHTTTLKYVTMSLNKKSEININTEMVNGCKNVKIKLHQNSEINKFWLIVTYEYDNNSTKKENTYFSVYEITITDEKLTFAEKCANIMSYCSSGKWGEYYSGPKFSDLLVDSTGLYVAEVSSKAVGTGNIELTTF